MLTTQVPRQDWGRANQVADLKVTARRTRRRADIRKASKAAIRLQKYFATSNRVAKKESDQNTTLVDKMRASNRQLHLIAQLGCVQV